MIIESPATRKLQYRHKKLARVADKATLEEQQHRAELWDAGYRPSMSITLHQDTSVLPADVLLTFTEAELARYAVHKRLATIKGDLTVTGEAVIDGDDFDCFADPPELEEVAA